MERWKKFQIKNREIWEVELSYPGEGVGHEEKFPHPCIIVKFNKFVDMATIIPLTSNVQTLKEFPHTYIINPNKVNRLTKQSIAISQNLWWLFFHGYFLISKKFISICISYF